MYAGDRDTGDILTLISGQNENLEDFAFQIWNRARFFYGYRITCLTLENLNWQNWTP
jgi:hypothetical protein